jgi:DNA-binding response OmpR family regulator
MHKDVVIVALTAYGMKGDERKARDAGCNGYITKPIDTGTFADVVRSYLSRQPSAAPVTVAGDSRDVLSELRNESLTEGAEHMGSGDLGSAPTTT